MAKGITIELQGLQKVLSSVKNLSQDIQKEVDMELSAATQEMATISKNLAPVDQGFLRNNISADTTTFLNKELISQAEYSAFIEFGTKTYVKVPRGLENIASQFRGKKGKGSLFNNIRNWLSRVDKGLNKKELDRKARYISYIIATKGIKPKPFFFRAYDIVKPKMLKNIKRVLDEKR